MLRVGFPSTLQYTHVYSQHKPSSPEPTRLPTMVFYHTFEKSGSRLLLPHWGTFSRLFLNKEAGLIRFSSWFAGQEEQVDPRRQTRTRISSFWGFIFGYSTSIHYPQNAVGVVSFR